MAGWTSASLLLKQDGDDGDHQAHEPKAAMSSATSPVTPKTHAPVEKPKAPSSMQNHIATPAVVETKTSSVSKTAKLNMNTSSAFQPPAPRKVVLVANMNKHTPKFSPPIMMKKPSTNAVKAAAVPEKKTSASKFAPRQHTPTFSASAIANSAAAQQTMQKAARNQQPVMKRKRTIPLEEDEAIDLIPWRPFGNLPHDDDADEAGEWQDVQMQENMDPELLNFGAQKGSTKNTNKKSKKSMREMRVELTRTRKARLITCNEQEDDYDPEKEVARLHTARAGLKQVLSVQLHRPFVVGRAPNCDYVVPDERISRQHFRLYAHKSDAGHAFVCCEDTSSTGILINDKRMECTSYILSDGDIVRLPNSQTFMYQHLSHEDDSSIEYTLSERWRVSSRILGTGHYAKVFLAADINSSQQVACKRQAKELFETKEDLRMLKREHKLLKRMSHPNISKLIDLQENESYYFFMMDLVCAGDLFNHVCLSNGPLNDAEAKFIFYQLSLAVMFLHQHGVVHRDIKPENILLLNHGRFPQIRLGDFGLATTFDPLASEPPRSSDTSGTVVYLAAEAMRTKCTGETYDPRGLDLWAMGVSLYLMLTGCHPFDHGDAVHTEQLGYQIQSFLLRNGEISETWVEQHGIAEDEELIMLDGAADTEYLASAKQALVNRIMSATFPALRNVDSKISSLLKELLELNTTKRLRASQLLKTPWIKSSDAELRKMYEVRVLRKGAQGQTTK